MGLGDIPKLLIVGEELRPVMMRLSKEAADGLDRLVNRVLAVHKTLLDELVPVTAEFRVSVPEEDDEEDEEGTEDIEVRQKSPQLVASEFLIAALRSRARLLDAGRGQPGKKAARVFEILGERAPDDSELATIGAKLATASALRRILNAPRASVVGIAPIYRRFRATHGECFVPDIDRSKISPAECDILLLQAIKSARWIFASNRRLLTDPSIPGWLEAVRQRFFVQVFVDEATDFSAVQLACTLGLAHPGLQSWFACGDFRQRVTRHGIQECEEMQWISDRMGSRGIELREIAIGYRQSAKLRQLTQALELQQPVSVESAGDSEDNVWPLLAENTRGEQLAEWIAARIEEVERSLGRLPSIAVFVDGDYLIDPLLELIIPRLAAGNIPVVGCKEGRVVGDRQEVRIFDVEHIKGLEFEAVFFVGIDNLCARVPDLFEKFIYVGVTRAATYLGVTCEGSLPAGLERTRPHFSVGNWGA